MIYSQERILTMFALASFKKSEMRKSEWRRGIYLQIARKKVRSENWRPRIIFATFSFV